MPNAGTKKGPLSVVQVDGDLNANGDLEAFGVDSSGMLYHTYQHLLSTSDGVFEVWSSWIPLSGFDVKQFAVGRNQDGSLAVVGIDGKGTVRYCSEETPGDSTSWSGWTPIGSGKHINDTPGALALVLDPDGYLELFAVTNHHSVEHASQLTPGGSAWSGWTPLGVASGYIATLTAGQNWDGRLEVFGADSSSGVVVHIAQLPGATGPSGAWSGGWTTLGSGYQMKKLAVARNADGRLELFGTDSSGRLAHIWQLSKGGPAWSGWTPLAIGHQIADFAVTIGADNRLTVCTALSNGSTQTSNSMVIQQDAAGDETYDLVWFLLTAAPDYYRINQIAISGHSPPGSALAVYGVDEEQQYVLWILANELVRDTVWELLVENSGFEV